MMILMQMICKASSQLMAVLKVFFFLKADKMMFFFPFDLDIKTSVTFAETQEGTVKIITRFKVEQ
jgi:hypothetical protein